jgi:GT2 family glycosyltransferase
MADINRQTVSIIIPSWNRRRLLTECITSITGSGSGHDIEIIVVDDASSDDTVEYMRSGFPDITIIENEVNRGYASSVNRGAARAKGGFLFLLNNDILLVENTLDRLISFLIENNDAGAAAPLLYHPDGRMQASCRRFPAPSALLLEQLGIDRIGPFHRWKLNLDEHMKAVTVQQPMASALMVRRECWDAVGPMDEGFPVFFNDVDWCYRLYKNTGYRIALCKEAKAVHHLGATVKALGWKGKKEFYRGLANFYLKHLPFRTEISK